MRERNTREIMSSLSKISKLDAIKMSYIMSHLEEINKKYNLKLTSTETKLLKERNNISVRNLRNPFDISSSMRPK